MLEQSQRKPRLLFVTVRTVTMTVTSLKICDCLMTVTMTVTSLNLCDCYEQSQILKLVTVYDSHKLVL